MAKIFLVSVIDMEPYSDYGNGPHKAFKTKEAAETFIKENDEVYEQGYFKWDAVAETDVPCDESDEDAWYQYGWKYSSYIQEIELVD